MTQKYLSEEYDPINESGRKSGKGKWSDAFYKEETGEFLGRTPRSWGKIVLFYVVFYCALALLFATCLGVFLQQWIDPRIPYRRSHDALLSPGLAHRPRPADPRSALLVYRGTKTKDFRAWKSQLEDFLSVYKKKGQILGAGQNIHNCNGTAPPPGKVCDVDITTGFTPCLLENHFDLHKSAPCIFLKLNKVYGWVPEVYEDPSQLPPDMPAPLRKHITELLQTDRLKSRMVWVSCGGVSPADREWVGPVSLLPAPGFPAHYFPYENAEGYLSPVLALHLSRPRAGLVLRVQCRAWARNLLHATADFEILLD